MYRHHLAGGLEMQVLWEIDRDSVTTPNSVSTIDAIHQLQHVIDGRTTTGQGSSIVECGPDGAWLYRLPEATAEEVDAAVAAAAAAQEAWRRTSVRDRAQILMRAATELEQVADSVATTLVQETGRVLAQARSEVLGAARILRDYAVVDPAAGSSVVSDVSSRVWGMEYREPLGVAALITAWNVPVQLAAHKIGAALMAGCTAVLKPAPLAAASPGAVVAAFHAAGLPSGALSLVHGGAAVARELAAHPQVGVVSFTGGQEGGRAIADIAAARHCKAILELGGKSANIVFDDAPTEGLVDGLVSGFVRNQGAVCTAATRIIVQESRYDEVVGQLRQRLADLSVGDPFEPGHDLGALRSVQAAQDLQDLLERAEREGHEVVGGEPVAVPSRSGAYRRPALVLAGDRRSGRLWREEHFLPLAIVVSVRDEAEAVEAANDSDHGLAAGIWTQDLQRAERVWSALDVGTVYVNSYHRIDGIPLASGGRRASGLGSEGGAAGVLEFMVTKSVHIPRAGA